MTKSSKYQTGQFVKHFLVCMFLVAIFLGCSEQDDSIELTSEVVPQTQTAIEPTTIVAEVPTATSLPTVAASVTPMPSLTPTKMATVAVSPTDVVTETAVSTQVYATPAHAADAYQVKEWTDDEAHNVVLAMREQIDLFESEPSEHYHMAHQRYMMLHRPLEVAAREGVLQFPNSRHHDWFLWNQAMAMAFRDMPQKSPSSLIVSLLEEGVARGEYDPEDWHSDYKIYDFILNKQFLVPNLLGNGQTIPIYKIQSIKSGYDSDGLFFALVVNDVEYNLLPITDFWHTGRGYWIYDAELADHTKDGIPELIVFPRYHSQLACDDDDILQWNGEEFVNLAKNPDGRNGGAFACLENLVFEEKDEDTADEIIVYGDEWFNDVSFIQQNTYVWDGEFYQLLETAVFPPENDDIYTMVEYHLYQQDYGAAAESIDPLLSYWQEGAFTLDPSYPDFFRFRQAWFYAVDGQAEKSREVFQLLIDEPVNPITPTLSIAAQSFLDHYQNQNDLYFACELAQETMMSVLNTPTYLTDDFLQAWGYTHNMNSFPCDLRLARQFLFEQVENMQPEEGFLYLEEAGVNISEKRQVDLNQDGVFEWLFKIQMLSEFDGYYLSQWLAFETNIGIQFALLRDLSETAVKWEVYYPPKADFPIHFVQDGKDFRISRFVIEDDGFEEIGYLNGAIEDFSVTLQDEILKVDIDYLGNATDFVIVTLLWNADTEDFEVVATNIPYFTGTSLYKVTDAAKNLIFENAQYEEAVAMLTEFHKVNEDYFPAEADYLLGLAYELSGKSDAAVETYWQLWQDFPESEYAMIVQQKLELK